MPLKGKQYKLDVDGDKKITRKDFMILSKNSKKKKKNGKANTQTNSYTQQTFKASFQETHGLDEETYA